MADRRLLKNAPIREAIIDFRIAPIVESAKAFDIELSTDFENYPKKEELNQGSIGFQFGKGTKITSEQTHMGYKFSSDDNKNIVQFRRDGFTFSRLEPYIDWEHMAAEAKSLWKTYFALTQCEVVTRVATRFINQLQLPLPINDFSEYLTAPPVIPEGLPQGVTSFLTRATISAGDIGAKGIITQAFEGKTDKYASVILDIDTYTDNNFVVEEDKYWPYLETNLRELKNNIFFKSITEKTAEMCE